MNVIILQLNYLLFIVFHMKNSRPVSPWPAVPVLSINTADSFPLFGGFLVKCTDVEIAELRDFRVTGKILVDCR